MATRRKASARKPRVFKLEGYIFAALRRIWRWHPARREAFRRAAGTGFGYFRCAACGQMAHKKSVHCDHMEPVVPVSGFVDWNTYIERLFCSVDNLAILCKPCHSVKTKAENAERRKYRVGRQKV